ncbi:MAG TPA: SAM-dependent methyltransferase [Beijerinckiaceae bacterium]|nr:SAM-dependent methyltransferase [Beijerinckiaceae bacterium]
MSALGDEIREMIASEGPISLERYMSLALWHPKHGYYVTRDALGASGDFITAPEISQMFGELIGVWAAEVWSLIGGPSPLRFVELGPGHGTLLSDALRAAKISPPFFSTLDVHLVEASPILKERQIKTLTDAGIEATWHERLEDVPPGPAIVIANEFFDALPVRHYVQTERGWCERQVGLAVDGTLTFGVGAEPETTIHAVAENGMVLEIGAAAYRAAATLATRLAAEGGAALVIDYGHTETSFGETLQAMHAHKRVDPLADPGLADLTAHVDFAALARAARACGASVQGPVTQGQFLSRLGIFERAASLKRRATPRQAVDIDGALLRLVGAGLMTGAGGRQVPGMGTLFKVMAITQPDLPMPAGFREGSTAP